MFLALAILLRVAPAAQALPLESQGDNVGLPQSSFYPELVVGGEDAPADLWPATAALLYGGYNACSGVLIAPEWVLTAGHCAPTVSDILLDTTQLDAPGEQVAVANFFAYPNASSSFDVALVQLAQPAQTPPSPIAMDCIAQDFAYGGAPVVIAGFGATDTLALQDATALQQAFTTLKDVHCEDETVGCQPGAMPDGEVIAGGDGVDSCSGDSGGPLYLETPHGPHLFAVTSRATIPATRPCGDGGIYVRVDAVRDWITEVIGEALSAPDCANLNRTPTLEAPAFSVKAGSTGQVQIELTDPNPTDQHRFTLLDAPAHGRAAVTQTGLLYYSASPIPSPPQTLSVHVVDDGEPPLEAVVEVTVHILHSGHIARGCATSPTPTAPAWLFLLLLARRWRP